MTRSAVTRTAALLFATMLVLPRLGEAVCAPSARGIFPASGIAGTSVTATVVGDALDGATASIFGPPGLTAVVQNASATQASLQIAIDPAAQPAERIIVLTTPGGQAGVSFTVNPAGGPVVESVTPVLIGTLGVPLDLTIGGQNLGVIDDVVVSGTGIAVTGYTATASSALLELDIAPGAELGTHAIELRSPLGGALLQLLVQRPAPTILTASPAAGEVGAVVPLTLSGTNLTGAALVIAGDATCDGIAISDVETPDDATLTAELTIDPGVTPDLVEPCLLIVTTEAGQTTAEFHVVPAGIASITGIRPGAGEPGQTVSIEVRGLHLTGASGVSTLSGDLGLGAPVVIDDETLSVEVSVAPGAATNADHTLTLTTPAGDAVTVFRVIPPGAPFIDAVRPPFGNRGSTITVLVHGVNLSTIVLGTGVDVSGPKVVESNASAIDDATSRAIFDIADTANVGFRDVTVTTENGSFTKEAAFRVNIPGQIPIITDVSPTVVDPGTTTAVTITGSNFLRAAVLVSGSGASIADVVIDPTGTTITFALTLDADAAAEVREVIVVTEDGIARCGIASTAPAPELVASKLVKTGAVFTVPTAGYRLLLFEFSMSQLFESGLRTWLIPSSDATLVLERLDVVNVTRAFRDRHRGFVRARGVTATNAFGVSEAKIVRR